MFDGEMLLNIVEASGVKVAFGGNANVLVTVDGKGHVQTYSSEPGFRLRGAITSVLQSMNSLNQQAAL